MALSVNSRYIGIYQFLSPTLLIRDPDLIKTIAVKEFNVFPDHRAFTTEETDPLGSKNLFALTGRFLLILLFMQVINF